MPIGAAVKMGKIVERCFYLTMMTNKRKAGQTDVNPTIKPAYYQYRGGDVFDMAQHFNLNFPLGNALKYLVRAGHKDPDKKIEDLQKCIKCINRAIELEAGRGD